MHRIQVDGADVTLAAPPTPTPGPGREAADVGREGNEGPVGSISHRNCGGARNGTIDRGQQVLPVRFGFRCHLVSTTPIDQSQQACHTVNGQPILGLRFVKLHVHSLAVPRDDMSRLEPLPPQALPPRNVAGQQVPLAQDPFRVRFHPRGMGLEPGQVAGQGKVHREFWDGVDFARSANPPREQWKAPRQSTAWESDAAFKRFAEYIDHIRVGQAISADTARVGVTPHSAVADDGTNRSVCSRANRGAFLEARPAPSPTTTEHET